MNADTQKILTTMPQTVEESLDFLMGHFRNAVLFAEDEKEKPISKAIRHLEKVAGEEKDAPTKKIVEEFNERLKALADQNIVTVDFDPDAPNYENLAASVVDHEVRLESAYALVLQINQDQKTAAKYKDDDRLKIIMTYCAPYLNKVAESLFEKELEELFAEPATEAPAAEKQVPPASPESPEEQKQKSPTEENSKIIEKEASASRAQTSRDVLSSEEVKFILHGPSSEEAAKPAKPAQATPKKSKKRGLTRKDRRVAAQVDLEKTPRSVEGALAYLMALLVRREKVEKEGQKNGKKSGINQALAHMEKIMEGRADEPDTMLSSKLRPISSTELFERLKALKDQNIVDVCFETKDGKPDYTLLLASVEEQEERLGAAEHHIARIRDDERVMNVFGKDSRLLKIADHYTGDLAAVTREAAEEGRAEFTFEPDQKVDAVEKALSYLASHRTAHKEALSGKKKTGIEKALRYYEEILEGRQEQVEEIRLRREMPKSPEEMYRDLKELYDLGVVNIRAEIDPKTGRMNDAAVLEDIAKNQEKVRESYETILSLRKDPELTALYGDDKRLSLLSDEHMACARTLFGKEDIIDRTDYVDEEDVKETPKSDVSAASEEGKPSEATYKEIVEEIKTAREKEKSNSVFRRGAQAVGKGAQTLADFAKAGVSLLKMAIVGVGPGRPHAPGSDGPDAPSPA